MRKIFSAAVAASILCVATPAAAQSLTGATVDLSIRYPTAATVYLDPPNVVVGSGVEFGYGSLSSYSPWLQADVQANRLVFTFDPATPGIGGNFGNVTFNGFLFSVLTGPAITTASVDASSGFAPTSLSILNGGLYLNFAGVAWTPGQSSIININATPAVPEPATWAMMLLGFGGIGFAMRRKGDERKLGRLFSARA